MVSEINESSIRSFSHSFFQEVSFETIPVKHLDCVFWIQFINTFTAVFSVFIFISKIRFIATIIIFHFRIYFSMSCFKLCK